MKRVKSGLAINRHRLFALQGANGNVMNNVEKVKPEIMHRAESYSEHIQGDFFCSRTLKPPLFVDGAPLALCYELEIFGV